MNYLRNPAGPFCVVPRLATVGLLLLGYVAQARALNHPGGFLTPADLFRIRAKVSANEAPWSTAWGAIKSSDAGLTYSPRLGSATIVTDSYAIQNDGHAAWVLAIKWVASADIAYAKKAENIIDTWVNQVTNMKSASTLRTGIGGSQMANAAEILAFGFNGAAGWPAANIAKAKAWFKNVPYNQVLVGGASANWGTADMAGCMAMAIFCDDQAMFAATVADYKNGFVPITSDGCCGVTQYIDATGEDAESGRDQGHSQGGIAHLMEVAKMAWSQGVDLVTYNDNYGVRSYGASGANRIYAGFEYTAKYSLGNDVPYHPYFEYCHNVTIYPGGISATGRGSFSPVWEMATSLFRAAGMPPTYSEQVTNTVGYKPEKTNTDHPGLGTLLYTPDNRTPSKGTSSVLNRNSGKALTVAGNSTDNGANVEQRTYAAWANQQWTVTLLGSNGYKIMGIGSSKSLDVMGNSTADGAKVEIWPSKDGNNQRWTFTPTDAEYFTNSSLDSGKVIEVSGSSTVEGAHVDQWSSTGGNNQQWLFRAPS